MKYNETTELHPKSGFVGIVWTLVLFLIGLALSIVGSIGFEEDLFLAVPAFVLGIILLCLFWIPILGIKQVGPNEALVLTLFGKYKGTISEAGFYTVNPFCIAIAPPRSDAKENLELLKSGKSISRKISLKIATLDNGTQKVNDILGNPLEISSIVVWRVKNATQAALNVDNYYSYLSSQTDSTIRNVARLYPYDTMENTDEPTLRSSTQEIADRMQEELQERVNDSGLEIIDVRLNQIAYAPEIAAAMLQRQQATAIIAARQKIVEGAVGMVEMALDELSKKQIVNLDDERKAQMVSNLLVVLCGSKDAQPIVNSGRIY